MFIQYRAYLILASHINIKFYLVNFFEVSYFKPHLHNSHQPALSMEGHILASCNFIAVDKYH